MYLKVHVCYCTPQQHTHTSDQDCVRIRHMALGASRCVVELNHRAANFEALDLHAGHLNFAGFVRFLVARFMLYDLPQFLAAKHGVACPTMATCTVIAKKKLNRAPGAAPWVTRPNTANCFAIIIRHTGQSRQPSLSAALAPRFSPIFFGNNCTWSMLLMPFCRGRLLYAWQKIKKESMKADNEVFAHSSHICIDMQLKFAISVILQKNRWSMERLEFPQKPRETQGVCSFVISLLSSNLTMIQK